MESPWKKAPAPDSTPGLPASPGNKSGGGVLSIILGLLAFHLMMVLVLLGGGVFAIITVQIVALTHPLLLPVFYHAGLVFALLPRRICRYRILKLAKHYPFRFFFLYWVFFLMVAAPLVEHKPVNIPNQGTHNA